MRVSLVRRERVRRRFNSGTVSIGNDNGHSKAASLNATLTDVPVRHTPKRPHGGRRRPGEIGLWQSWLRALSAYLRIAATLYVFVLSRFFSENRFTLFRKAL